MLPIADGASNTTEVGTLFLFALFAALFIWIGWKRNFFQWETTPWTVPLQFIHVIGAFAIYFIGSILTAAIYSPLSKIGIDSTLLASWFNFGASGLIFVFLILFWRCLSPPIRSGIWKRDSSNRHSYTEDIGYAFLAWFISFPLVLFLSNFFEFLVLTFFQLKQLPDQLAVQFLKLTFGKPIPLILAAISIVIFAPILEELLFRGFLQSFIRKHLGPKSAILITSFCFAFFHYSSDQGLGNIPIIASLFFLALFLGFLYERQGCLLSPIALHASFNTVSILNLYFLGGIPGGI